MSIAFVDRWKMMAYFGLAFLLASVGEFLRPLGGGPMGLWPDFYLALTVASGYCYGAIPGLVVGLLCGFMRDYMYGRLLGVGMVLFVFYGVFSSLLFPKRFPFNRVLPFVQFVLSSIVGTGFLAGLMAVLPSERTLTLPGLAPYQPGFQEYLFHFYLDLLRTLPLDFLTFALSFYLLRYRLPLKDRQGRPIDPAREMEMD